MDIRVAIDNYLACRRNPLAHNTYRWYSWGLRAFESWCQAEGITELCQITASLVQQFVAVNPKAKGNTRHHKAQIIKTFLNWCAQDPAMGVDGLLVQRLEMPLVDQEEIEVYTEKEILRLLMACEKTQNCLRNRALLLLLLETGIRLSELAYDGGRPEEWTGLLLENVIFGRQESYIVVMGKGRKTRTVKIGNETCQVLQEYLEYERPISTLPYFFLERGNRPLGIRRLDKILKDLGRLAQVENVHAHRFRHTFAIQQLLARTNALVLMQIMGHESLEATKVYTRALSQMQARLASASVVEEMWQGSQRLHDFFVRSGSSRKASLKAEMARKREQEEASSVVILPQKTEKLSQMYAQWTQFFQAWWKWSPDGRWTTSEVWGALSDVSPVQPGESEHPKAFLYRMRSELYQRLGVAYGETPVALRLFPAVKRGMHQWQVYQVSVPE